MAEKADLWGNFIITILTRTGLHKDADITITVHVQHALNKGCRQVFVYTVDKDVLVIMIGIFHDLIALCPSAAIWVGLGSVSASFIHSLDATRLPVSLTRVRSPPG